MEKSKKKLGLGAIIGIAAGAAVLLAAIASAVIIPIRVSAQNAAEHAEAMAREEAGEYTVAYELYSDLGSYGDAAERAKFCADTVAYARAENACLNGDYTGALTIFTGLGTFSDSAQRAATCQNEIDLAEADELYDAGDYEAALPVYQALGDYKDAAKRAIKCSREIDYLAGKDLMTAGDYAAAQQKLTPLSDIMYKDAAALVEECGCEISYAEATELLAAGKNYDAYVKFDALADEDFKDSAAKAKECTVPFPETGVLYRNEAVSGSNTQVKLQNKNSSYGFYLKILTEDGTLAATVFAQPGESQTVKLPAGKYKVKEAYGSNWFGEEEAFGEDGTYFYALEDADDKTSIVCNLRNNYIFTLMIPDQWYFTFGDVKNMSYSEF